MPLFVERFVLPCLATVLVAVILSNSMGLDAIQRASAIVAIVSAAFFCAYSLHVRSSNIAAAQNKTMQSETTVSHPAPETQTLVDRADDLSKEILRFLGEREAGVDPFSLKKETWEQDTQALMNYGQRTRDMYAERFGAKAVAITHELKMQGFYDRELESMAGDAVNPLCIRDVGVRLGALAERLRHANGSRSN